MKNKKYELVKDDFIIHEGRKLYRIRALRDVNIPSVMYSTIYRGDIGGYVEGYHNLSQDGNCWIENEAKVYGNARVSDNAFVEDDTKVYGNAIVRGCSEISEEAQVFGNAVVKDDAYIYDNATIYGNAVIKGCARVYEKSQIFGNAVVNDVGVGASKVHGNAVVLSSLSVSDLNNVDIYSNTIISTDIN